MSDRTRPDDTLLVHASTVAWDRRAVVITGASGSGKSTLALELLAYGGTLIADDQTLLRRVGADLIASAPASISGQIEARGVGILNATSQDAGTVALIVDLNHVETSRLPPQRSTSYIGVNLPLIYRSGHVGFGPAILQMLKAARSA